MSRIDDLEMLVDKLSHLIEAEFLALEAMPDMVREIRGIHNEAIDQIVAVAKKLLRRSPSLGARGSHLPVKAMGTRVVARRIR